MPVLDTTLLIAVDRRPPGIDVFFEELVESAEPLFVPAQVAIEYAAGREDPAEAMRRLREAFVLVPCGPDIALEAARLARDARRAGLFPGWADVQVAATARHEGMAVVTATPGTSRRLVCASSCTREQVRPDQNPHRRHLLCGLCGEGPVADT